MRLMILGGAGAFASTYAQLDFLSQWTSIVAVASDRDFPSILHLSLNDLGVSNMGQTQELKLNFARSIARAFNPTFTLVPCNSIQRKFEQLDRAEFGRFYNMEESYREWDKSQLKPKIMLASLAARNQQFCESDLTSYPDEIIQQQIDFLIQEGIKGNFSYTAMLHNLVQNIVLKGAIPVLGCSELSPYLNHLGNEVVCTVHLNHKKLLGDYFGNQK